MLTIKKTTTILLLFLFCTGIFAGLCQGVSDVSAKVTVGSNARTFEEKKRSRGPLEMENLFTASKESIVSYYKDEDGVNQRAVYKVRKDSWSADFIKDSAMKYKGKKTFYNVYPIENGYVEVAPDSSRIVVRHFKGKKLKSWKMEKIRGWKQRDTIQKVLSAGKNTFIFVCQNGVKKMPRAVCVNMVKRNVKWVREGVSPDSLLVMNSKLYSYSYHSDKVGNPSKKSDVVNVYRLKDGKPCSWLDATPIRNRVTQLKGEVTEDAYPITDQAMTFASCKGKIYAAYLSGIYVYQEKAKNWKCVVDGVNNETFSPGKGMTIIDLLAYSDKAFYVLAAKGNYDGEATDFLQYKLK